MRAADGSESVNLAVDLDRTRPTRQLLAHNQEKKAGKQRERARHPLHGNKGKGKKGGKVQERLVLSYFSFVVNQLEFYFRSSESREHWNYTFK
jgi:hypothetical protein